MTKPNSQRKTRSDKFPLTLHKTGQYCKKIKGKFYYLGSDREQAMRRYLEQATYLHTAKGERLKLTQNSILLKTLCNLYLDHQETRSAIGEALCVTVATGPRHCHYGPYCTSHVNAPVQPNLWDAPILYLASAGGWG